MSKIKLTTHWLPIQSFDEQINSTDSEDQCDWYVIWSPTPRLTVVYVHKWRKHSGSLSGCQWVCVAGRWRLHILYWHHTMMHLWHSFVFVFLCFVLFFLFFFEANLPNLIFAHWNRNHRRSYFGAKKCRGVKSLHSGPKQEKKKEKIKMFSPK